MRQTLAADIGNDATAQTVLDRIWTGWTHDNIITAQADTSHPWPASSQPISNWPAAIIVSSSHTRGFWATITAAARLRLVACADTQQAAALLDKLTTGPALLICDLRTARPPTAQEFGRTAPAISDPAILAPDCGDIALLEAASRTHQCPLLLVCDLASLDTAFAHACSPLSLLLCDPDEPTLLGALAILLHQNRPVPMLHDNRSEPDASQLARLSDELIRLSEMIETLMRDGAPPTTPRPLSHPSPYAVPCDTLSSVTSLGAPRNGYRATPAGDSNGKAQLTAQNIRALLRARRLRDQLLPGGLFADPAWDILLDLMAARLEGRRVSVSSLCIAAFVPPTTALRWIKQLTDQGLLVRQADNVDGRRAFISLSEEGAHAVEQWFVASRDMLLAAAR